MPRYKKVDKKIYIRRRIFVIFVLFLMIFGIYKIVLAISNITSNITPEISKNENEINNNEINNIIDNTENNIIENTVEVSSTSVDEENEEDWKIKLVNANNILPDDFEVELANIDSIRQFDKRAISELNQMMNAMRKAGITNVWVQSAYRSVEKQREVFNKSIAKYKKQRKDRGRSRRINNEINK